MSSILLPLASRLVLAATFALGPGLDAAESCGATMTEERAHPIALGHGSPALRLRLDGHVLGWLEARSRALQTPSAQRDRLHAQVLRPERMRRAHRLASHRAVRALIGICDRFVDAHIPTRLKWRGGPVVGINLAHTIFPLLAESSD